MLGLCLEQSIARVDRAPVLAAAEEQRSLIRDVVVRLVGTGTGARTRQILMTAMGSTSRIVRTGKRTSHVRLRKYVWIQPAFSTRAVRLLLPVIQ